MATLPAYYAGLNLVILAVSIRDTEYLAGKHHRGGAGLFMFVAACLLHPVLNLSGRVFYSYTSQQSLGMLVNSWYTMLLTSTIVVTGNFFFNRLRFREFMLRFEVDRNRQNRREATRSSRNWTRSRAASSRTSAMNCARRSRCFLAPLETLLHSLH